MIQYLENTDRQLFLLINGLHTPWMDVLMYWFSNKFIWIPLYILLIYAIWRMWNFKTAMLALVFIGITVGITDAVSVHAFKDVFMRYRPCHNLQIENLVHLVHNHCGGMYGFVSSHAANHFAVAGFLFALFYKKRRTWSWLLILWAAIICYSRVYLGVHYPADVTCGALVGIAISALTYTAYSRMVLRKQPAKTDMV